jgi:hypothetical protein
MIIFLYILWLVAAEAISEAKHDLGLKKDAKLIQFFWIASWFLLPVIVHANNWFYLLIPVAYILLRMGVFDMIYNKTVGNPLDYQSRTTYVWDWCINKIKKYPWLYAAFIVICILGSFTILSFLV